MANSASWARGCRKRPPCGNRVRQTRRCPLHILGKLAEGHRPAAQAVDQGGFVGQARGMAEDEGGQRRPGDRDSGYGLRKIIVGHPSYATWCDHADRARRSGEPAPWTSVVSDRVWVRPQRGPSSGWRIFAERAFGATYRCGAGLRRPAVGTECMGQTTPCSTASRRLQSASDAQFGEDVLDVSLRGAGTDVERLGDGGVRTPGGDQAEDFDFPRGQAVLIRRARRRGGGTLSNGVGRRCTASPTASARVSDRPAAQAAANSSSPNPRRATAIASSARAG